MSKPDAGEPINPNDDANKGVDSLDHLSAYERWELPNIDDEDQSPKVKNPFTSKQRVHVAAPVCDSTPAEPVNEVVPLTAEDLEQIRQAAYEEGMSQGQEAGYREGHEKGYREGFDAGKSDLDTLVARLGQISRALLEPVASHDRELEETLLSLVENIATRVVQRELIIDSSSVLVIVKEALACLNPAAQRIRIHLNPDDADQVIKALQNSGEWQDSWRFLSHDTISPGGCIIDTENSVVDARAEKRLATVIRQVYEKDERVLHDDAGDGSGIEQLLGEIDPFDNSEAADEP